MRSALRLPTKVTPEAANEDDPREAMDGNVTDLASRHALPTVAKGKKGSDTATMLAGVAIVALLGAAAFWSMDTARTASDEVAPAPQQEVAAAPAAAETVKAEEPSAAPQQAAPKADLAEHLIAQGETTGTIAADYGTTVHELVSLNGLPQGGALIYAGDIMLVPATGASHGGGSYTIQSGDTLAEIAHTQGVDLDTLVSVNGIDDPDFIVAGDTLHLG